MGKCNLYHATLLAAGLAAGTLGALPLHAAVIGASGAPALTTVATTGSAVLTVDWTVQRLVASPPLSGTISSPALRVLINGKQAASLPQHLSRQITSEQATTNLRLREKISLPQSLIYRALKQGGRLRLVRQFSDSLDDVTAQAFVEVVLDGPGSQPLAVQRLELAFDDGTRTRVLPKGEDLRVVAEINSSGVGLIAGVWEVASGAAVGEAPAFRTLSLVRQGAAGGGRSVITSPRLPSLAEGTAFVRFRITDPKLTFAAPTLQYYVTPPRPVQQQHSPQEVRLSAPDIGTMLTADTRFAWTALAGAKAYQVVFYAIASGPSEPLDTAALGQPASPETLRKRRETGEAAMAGAFVPGGQNEAMLEDHVLTQLPPERSYLWQVTAFDANGAVIGSSSLREIYKP